MNLLIYDNDGHKRPYDQLTTHDRMVIIVEQDSETWIGISDILDLVEERIMHARKLQQAEDNT